MAKAALTFSSVWNRLTGQGGTGDHGMPGDFAMRPPKSPHEIEALLEFAPLIRTAVEAMPEDIVRVWRTYPEGADKWVNANEAADLIGTAERALIYAEAFGGAIIMARYDRGAVPVSALEMPFRQPRKGALLGFKVFAPHQINASGRRNGERQANGLPVWYQLKDATGQAFEVHHSWTLPVWGPTSYRTTSTAGTLHGLLGQSRVDLIYDDFARMASGLQSMMHALAKANIDVLKVQGLADALAKCSTTEQMQEQLYGMLQSHTHTIQGANTYQPMVIDSAEALERHNASTANAAPAMSTLIDMFVAATRIPRTRLLGEQSKGIGNGGDADLTHYYDRCGTMRERRLTPLLNWADALIAADQSLSATMWEYAPLWTPTAKERAEVDKIDADIDAAYSALDIPFIRTKVALRLAESGRYNFTEAEIAEIAASDGPIDPLPEDDTLPDG